MKRSTWYMVGAFAALLVIYLATTWRPKQDTPPPLSIDGYIGNVDEQTARSQAKDKPPPVKRVVLKRKDEEIVFDRLPPEKTDKPEVVTDLKWTAKRTYKGKVTDTKAQGFRVQSMSETLMRSIRSSYALRVKATELAEYGLDADKAIDVQWDLDNRTVKLRIGLLQKPDDGEPNTWVQNPGVPDVVYQIAARDLRTSFDSTWSDLRDRSVLTLKLPAIERIQIDNPHDKKAKHVVATRPALTDAQQKELADKKQERDAADGWTIEEPKNVVAGDIGDWLKAIDRFSVSEFLDPADAVEKKLDTGLDEPAVRVTVTVGAGPTAVTITFGKADETRPNKEVYARIEGRDELYLVATYTRDQIVQTLDQLRDRRLLGDRKGKDATTVTLWQSSGDKLLATKESGNWAVIGAPAGYRTSPAAVDSFLNDLDSIKLDYALPEPATAAGLETPGASAEIRFGDQALMVILGNEVDGNVWGRVMRLGGLEDTFKVSTWNAGRIKKKLSDFADKRLLSVPAGEVAEAWLEPADGKDAVHLMRDATGTGWTWEAGGKSGAAKAEAVDGVLRAALDLEWTAEHPDKKPDAIGLEKGFASLRVRTKAGVIEELRISEQKSGDDPYVATVRGGKIDKLAAVSSWAAGNLKKTKADFAD
jgi:hypothetical protein